METVSKIARVSTEMERLFTLMAKACLKVKPDDVERFCLELLARRQGVRLESTVTLTRGGSVAIEDDISELVNDMDAATLVPPTPNRSNVSRVMQPTYVSSSESDEDEVKKVASYHSISSAFEEVEELSASDLEDAAIVKTAALGNGSLSVRSRNVCYLFKRSVISADELQQKTQRYQNDERMKSLFRAWDGDDSGAVDFVELVLALHKFEDVARAGIDINVASDALVEFVESDTARELKLSEFTQVIILFCLNHFQKDFEEVADYMLAVATSSSEKAVLKAASGVDISEIVKADKEEQEILRQTMKGIESHVNDNIQKIRIQRIAVRGSKSKDDEDNE